jgi:hypothetical protein
MVNYGSSSVAASSFILRFWDELLLRPVSEQKDTLWLTVCIFESWRKSAHNWTKKAAKKWQDSRLGSALVHPSLGEKFVNEDKSDFESYKKSVFKALVSSMDLLGI